jgi:CBS domain-containing protein
MTETLVRDVMSPNVRLIGADDSIKSAAEAMEADDIGAVVVVDEGRVRALVTDRDIVVRAIARGLDPQATSVWEIASTDLVAVAGDAPVSEAVRLMRDRALHRVLVFDQEQALAGVVTLGDVAAQRDPRSALADITNAPPNR